jgi:hypothetical protein
VSTRLIGWPAAALAMLITLALVIGELTNAGQRRWWAAHPLTTDTVAGLLVLLITVLVVNQLLNRRQAAQRGHAVAAQAAIMVAQAARSAKAMSSVTGGSGDRGSASCAAQSRDARFHRAHRLDRRRISQRGQRVPCQNSFIAADVPAG